MLRETEIYYANMEHCTLQEIYRVMRMEMQAELREAWDDVGEEKTHNLQRLAEMEKLLAMVEK
jgi:hypothetical protein